LLQAIRDALRGRSYVAPEIRLAMNEIFVRDPKAVDRPQHLTDRQREVLQMLAEGRSLREIAELLKISVSSDRCQILSRSYLQHQAQGAVFATRETNVVQLLVDLKIASNLPHH
jgi:DNA-binding NarL/FixJ family response regulator